MSFFKNLSSIVCGIAEAYVYVARDDSIRNDFGIDASRLELKLRSYGFYSEEIDRIKDAIVNSKPITTRHVKTIGPAPHIHTYTYLHSH